MSAVHSMTGFSSVEGEAGGHRLRIEAKSLNHRHVDVKVRLPREFAYAEIPLRAGITSRIARGAIEVRIDRIDESSGNDSAPQLNLGRAAHYYESLVTLQKTLGLNDPIRTIEIASLPDVFSRASSEAPLEDAWKLLEPLIDLSLSKLGEMRAYEGAALARVLRTALDELQAQIDKIRGRRGEWEALAKKKFEERIRSIFEAYPVASTSIQGVLESRVAQELSLLLERSDVEEELTRFQGHLEHFRKVLDAGGPVGRKLDFILQELNREINTLSNKAQDLQISEEAVQMKLRIEQVREQVMNLE